MKTYYHVSRDIDTMIPKFIPKIPGCNTVVGEDKTIKRISICESIVGCLNGVYYTHDNEFTTLKKCLPVKIYEFHLNEADILSPAEILKYVPDSIKTKECWSIKEIVPTNSYIIEPSSINQEKEYPFFITDIYFETYEYAEYVNQNRNLYDMKELMIKHELLHDEIRGIHGEYLIQGNLLNSSPKSDIFNIKNGIQILEDKYRNLRQNINILGNRIIKLDISKSEDVSLNLAEELKDYKTFIHPRLLRLLL